MSVKRMYRHVPNILPRCAARLTSSWITGLLSNLIAMFPICYLLWSNNTKPSYQISPFHGWHTRETTWLFNMGIAYNHDTLIAHSTQTSYYNWLFNWYLYVKIAGLIFTLLNSFITLKLKFSLNTTFVKLLFFCFSKQQCNMSVFSPFITPFMESVYNILIAYLYNFSI